MNATDLVTHLISLCEVLSQPGVWRGCSVQLVDFSSWQSEGVQVSIPAGNTVKLTKTKESDASLTCYVINKTASGRAV